MIDAAGRVLNRRSVVHGQLQPHMHFFRPADSITTQMPVRGIRTQPDRDARMQHRRQVLPLPYSCRVRTPT